MDMLHCFMGEKKIFGDCRLAVSIIQRCSSAPPGYKRPKLYNTS